MDPYITALYIYPVKSCQGIAVSSLRLGTAGPAYDRTFMVVDASGKFLSQRKLTAMALIRPTIGQDESGETILTIATPKVTAPLVLPFEADYYRNTVEVTVHNDTCSALDAGDQAAQWFSEVLKKKCRLVRTSKQPERCIRPGDNPKVTYQYQKLTFADAYPLHLINQVSLDDLSHRLGKNIPHDRFRPNIVVAGCPPYAEDHWDVIQSNNFYFKYAKLCDRCKIPTIDQETAQVTDADIIKMLLSYHAVDKTPMFGINLVHIVNGTIAVDDILTIVKEQEHPQLPLIACATGH